MKKFLRHSWPILVLILTQIIQFQAPAYLGIVESFYVDRFLPDFTLMSSLVAIYYLYTSPFTREQNLSLSLLIGLRFINYELLGLAYMYREMVEIGLECLIILFYVLRTRAKEIIRLGDKVKAFSLVTFFILSVIKAIIDINTPTANDFRFYLEEPQKGFLTGILETVSFFLILIFIIIHLTMLYKWNDKYISEAQDMMIDQIGK